jgi:hypothetical protein
MRSADAIAASASLGALLLVAISVATLIGGPWGLRRLAAAILVPASQVPALLVVAWVGTRSDYIGLSTALFLWFLGSAWVRARVSSRPFRRAPFQLADPGLAARTAASAAKLGMRPPDIVVSATSAWVGACVDAVTPTLVLARRTLLRLDAIDVDAIVAHELGHAYTWSLYLLIALGPASALAAMLLIPALGPAPALAAGWWMLTLSWRLLNRPYELACDRVAADIVGNEAVRRMLTKITAMEGLGLVGHGVHAMSTHPDLALRLEALGGPPADDSRRISRIGLASLAVAGCVGVAVSVWSPMAGTIVLVSAALTPRVLATVSARAMNRRRFALLMPGRAWERFMLAALVASVLPGVAALLWPSVILLLALILAQLALLVGAGVFATRRRALAIATGPHPETITRMRLGMFSSRDPVVRHRRALALRRAGLLSGTVSEFSEIVARHPRFLLAHLSLAQSLLYSDPERSLRHARLVSAGDPDQGDGPAEEARVLLELGRVDEASEAADRAVFLDARVGAPVAALVAVRRGDRAGARRWLAEAELQDPGSLIGVIAAAELAIAEDDAGAPAAVVRAKAIAAISPLAVVGPHLSRLEAQVSRVVPVSEAIATEVAAVAASTGNLR